MFKAVVYSLVTSAFILLIVFSQTAKTNSNKNHVPHALNRRLGYKIPPPTFDPLVEKLERLAESNGSSHHGSPANSSTSKLEDDDEYFFNDGRLNVTLRLMVLFPFLDREPKDGMVDSEELEAWILQQAIDRLHFTTERELSFYDKDGDGAISFSEYLPRFSIEDIERNEMGHGEAGWWKEQFDNADADRNGTLSFSEFRDFLHPEDSKNEQIHKWLLREKIRQMDYDKDEKVDLLEFEKGAYDTYKNYVEFKTGGENVPSPQDVFTRLDVNKDKLLEVEELKPILGYLSPGELTYAKYYTTYLIQEADENGDGKLTIDEMIKHEYVFYNTLYENDNDEDDEDLHDEL